MLIVFKKVWNIVFKIIFNFFIWPTITRKFTKIQKEQHQNTKLKKSDDRTKINKYRVATNITEYHKLIIPEFMKKGWLFHVNNVCINIKNQNV